MATSKKIIDIANSLDFVNDYNNIGITGNNARISTSTYGEFLLYSTSTSTNGSTGSVVLYNGGLSINCTTNASSITRGGAITIMGGASIFKSLLVGGNIGINTSNPTVHLDVNGSGNFINTNSTNSTTTNLISTNITSSSIITTNITTSNINFTGNIYQNGSLYVSSQWKSFNNNIAYTTGSVGIATTAPGIGITLDVAGTGRFTNIISTAITTNTLQATNITTGNINFTGNLYQNGAFFVPSQWTSFTTNIAYTNGNVGIGTTSPSYRLDVSGNYRFSNATSSSIITTTTASDNVLQIQNNSSVGNSSIQYNDYLSNTKLFTGYSNPFSGSALAGSSYIMSDTATSLKLVAGNKTTVPVILNASDNSVSITSSVDSTDIYSGSLKVSGGIGVEKTIQFGNYIASNSTLLEPPTTSTYGGNGSRFIISRGSLTTTPYAIGIENGHMWNSSPYGGYKWYTNTTASMQLTTGNLVIVGDITAFGNISDKRLKHTITPIDNTNALDIINTLEPVTFIWKDNIANTSRRGSKDVGFIAQEVEKLIPYAVSEFTDLNTGEIFKNMKHERIIPYLVAAVQHLHRLVKNLQNN
jgi:hypothetical protein